MSEFKPPTFGEDPRKESPGEAQQRLASLLRTLLTLAGITLTENERQALAVVLGAVMRAYPALKET